MNFTLEYDSHVLKFLSKLDKHIAQRIIDKLEEILSITPIPHDAKAIVGEHGVFRLRIGDFRALYRINFEVKKVIIVKIDNRERVY